jgi:hypothetical protein
MLLNGKGTAPSNLPVKSSEGGISAQILGFEGVKIGDYVLCMKDLCEVVRYALRNTNLEGEGDPRLKLIAEIKTAQITEGYSDNTTRGPKRRIVFAGDQLGQL